MNVLVSLQNQALDIVLVALWAFAIAWGVSTGVLRQLTLLVAAIFAPIVAFSLAGLVGGFVAAVMSTRTTDLSNLIAYVLVYVLAVVVVAFLFWRTYPHTRLVRHRGLDAMTGGIVGAIWAALVLMFCVAMLRAYTGVFLPSQQFNQQHMLGLLQASSAMPLLHLVLSPVWDTISHWFPAGVPTNVTS